MNHIQFCESNAPLEIRMPISSPTTEFVNWQKTQNVPFVVYADLGAIDVCSVDAQRIASNTKKMKDSMPEVSVPSSWTKELNSLSPFLKTQK